ncbi:MAG: HTH domain-containing protein, partial [Mariprofundaceae bacterium]|nr:HTH domain-containing protein [Mariprofundaceae bacterium]
MNPNRDAILARLAGSSLPVSGDALAHELGLSRAAVWKH